jgi:hypothetical protein
MRHSTLISIGLLGLALPVAASAQIHKCTTPEAVVYRDTPCAEGHRETLINTKAATHVQTVAVNAKASVRADQGAYTSAPYDGATPLPLPGTLISVGMSDLEVLNLRGWGRPSKITRSKMNGVWREQWVYGKPSDAQRHLLQFVNARLAAIDTEASEPAPQPLIQLTQQ